MSQRAPNSKNRSRRSNENKAANATPITEQMCQYDDSFLISEGIIEDVLFQFYSAIRTKELAKHVKPQASKTTV
tara:strand:+ start:63 stop:284 length:222 start_codon:yes stop_codon:yes gene_type:complete